VSYCPRSSLPAHVLAWLAARLAHLHPARPPGQGGTPPLSLEVRLDAVAAVLLDGLSYRRAGRTVGISKTEVGDSLDLLLGPLAAVGYCQPDGTFITTWPTLASGLGRWSPLARWSWWTGWPPGCSDPTSGPTRRSCTTPSGTPTPPRAWRYPRSGVTCCGSMAAGPAAATSTSSSNWQGCRGCWTASRSQACWIGGSAGWPRRASTGMCRLGAAAPRTAQRRPAGVQPRAGGPARAGGAGDRPFGQRLGVAPLAGAAVSRPGRLPRRRRADLPRPLAAPCVGGSSRRTGLNATDLVCSSASNCERSATVRGRAGTGAGRGATRGLAVVRAAGARRGCRWPGWRGS